MNFVFYDTETTGTDTAFDQILQFAAIYADSEFKEIDRFEIRCRLLPHIVPAPGAMVVTGVTVKQLTDESLPTHYEMIREIRKKLLSWSPAIFIGHNSLDFDEHLLRQAFYQTLHPPYLTNTDGNCRSDTLSLIQAASLFAPDLLKFPTNEKGEKVFKLDRLAPLNGFDHTHAHDALGDVEATIHLCKIIHEKAPEVWATAMRFNQKSAVINFTQNGAIFSLSKFFFGKPYSWLMVGIGANSTDASELFVFDLATDPAALVDLSDEQLLKRLKESPKPVRRFRANSCPILMPPEKAPAIATSISLGMEELRRRAHMLTLDSKFRDRLIALFISINEKAAVSMHVEEQIYDEFLSGDDQRLAATFHKVAWEERIGLIQQFTDTRLKILGLRLLYFERPDLLDKAIYSEHTKYFAGRISSGDSSVPWLTLPEAIQEIDAMLVTADGCCVELLQEHRKYLVECLTRMQREKL